MPCTCRMVTPYSSPPNTKVRNCSAPEDGSVETTCWFILVNPHAGTGATNDSWQIEDLRNGAIAEDGRAGDAVDVAVIGFERFDDDLLLAEEVVDEETDAAAFAFDDHDEPLIELARARLDAEQLVQANHRHVVAAEREHFAATRDAIQRALLDLQRFDDADERNDVVLLAHRDRLAVDDGERQRQRDDETRAMSGRIADVDGAAELLDVTAHDIETDAAARDVGGRLGGGEAWHEDELDRLIV